ncbi:MAG: hypothetical protein ACTSW4_02460 [Candidatus Ranarchaeia archaeon]
MPKKKKEAISQVIRALERAELRANTYYSRAHELHARSREALLHSNENEAKTYLASWNYNKEMGDTYLRILTNLQRQLDVMQETEDLKVFANACEIAQDLMKREAPQAPIKAGLQARAQFRAKAAETRSAMQIFSRQMHTSGSLQKVDAEFLRLQQQVSLSPTGHSPSPLSSFQRPGLRLTEEKTEEMHTKTKKEGLQEQQES